MKIQNIFYLYILFSSFYFIKSEITIIGPNNLSSKFRSNIIEMTYDKIGKSNYDFYTRGQLFIEENNLEACQRTSLPKNLDNSQFNEGFRILIAKRGGCSFVYKARNAQIGGYAMVIVVNNMQTDIKKIIMTDDGSGNDIYIPIAMISQDDGTKIINYLIENKNSNAIVEINFTKKIVKNKTLDVKFFFSSSNLRAYELFNNLGQYMNKFGDQVDFTPIYVVHRSPMYDENNPIRVVNCVSKGKYCYFPKATTITNDGQAIIMEDLRQKCIYNLAKTSNNIFMYLNYLKTFHAECLVKENKIQFNEKCAKDVLKTLGYSILEIDSCMAKSFRATDLLSNTHIDNENFILESEYEELIKYKLTIFPSVIIDNKQLDGVIKETKIITEICNLIKDKPGFCFEMIGKGSAERKKFIILMLIFILVVINIFIFLVFRKYIIERINERIVKGGLDLDSRIKNVIGNYFSLNKINNDYVRMANNPTNSKDLATSKGQVVDIDVEAS
jgi:hypothetical protein